MYLLRETNENSDDSSELSDKQESIFDAIVRRKQITSFTGAGSDYCYKIFFIKHDDRLETISRAVHNPLGNLLV
nr:15877_t:CDS:2 [Entrophospora candida]